MPRFFKVKEVLFQSTYVASLLAKESNRDGRGTEPSTSFTKKRQGKNHELVASPILVLNYCAEEKMQGGLSEISQKTSLQKISILPRLQIAPFLCVKVNYPWLYSHRLAKWFEIILIVKWCAGVDLVHVEFVECKSGSFSGSAPRGLPARPLHPALFFLLQVPQTL